MEVSFILSEDAWYDPQIYGTHTNKIAGFTLDRKITINTCGIWNHRNSLRVGWKPQGEEEGVFQISLYAHINGCIYKFKPYKEGVLMECKANELVKVELIDDVEYFYLYADYKDAVLIDRSGLPIGSKGYILGPYHGGNPSAHKDYTIDVNIKY
jgi:hypothetical protein